MKKIAIVTNSAKDIGFMNTKRFVSYVSGKAELYMESGLSVLGMDVNYVEYEKLFETADIMVVLGGDGTMLQIAAMCAKNDIPVKPLVSR